MSKGLILLILGVLLNVLGYFIKGNDLGHYGWAMIIGTVLFGVGFLLVFYSLVRKFERQAILEERALESGKMSNHDDKD